MRNWQSAFGLVCVGFVVGAFVASAPQPHADVRRNGLCDEWTLPATGIVGAMDADRQPVGVPLVSFDCYTLRYNTNPSKSTFDRWSGNAPAQTFPLAIGSYPYRYQITHNLWINDSPYPYTIRDRSGRIVPPQDTRKPLR
jgi:hypothetical protein